MKRRNLLKLFCSLPAVALPEYVASQTAKPVIDVSLPILGGVTWVDEEYVDVDYIDDLHILCRRIYDGEAKFDIVFFNKFLEDAKAIANKEFGKVVCGPIDGVSVYWGRHDYGFDSENNCMTKPPYYFWCRSSVSVPKSRIIGDATHLHRRINGLLPYRFI